MLPISFSGSSSASSGNRGDVTFGAVNTGGGTVAATAAQFVPILGIGMILLTVVMIAGRRG